MDATRREALLKEYSEVGSNFRLLTDIRFKLLGFLPIAAAAAAALKGDALGIKGFSLSLFGLVTTLGVAMYNARNNQFYNELIKRAASIERDLSLPDGYFANRPRAWLDVPLLGLSIDHGTGIAFIYAASIALWAFGILAPFIEFVRHLFLSLPASNLESVKHFLDLHLPAPTLDFVRRVDPAKVVNILAFTLAIVLTLLGTLVVGNHKTRRTNELGILAAEAVRKATGLTAGSVAKDKDLLWLCWKLSGKKTQEPIRSRAQFYSKLDTVSLGYYIPSGSPVYTAAHIVALLTDLSPRWLFDCATNRQGEELTAEAKSWSEWLLILGGVSSVLFGFGVILALGAGAHLPVWIIGTYAVIMGGLLVAIAFRLKK
jgi:hypothetical protein